MHWLLSFLLLAALPSLNEEIRRVQAHLLIDDVDSALKEAEQLARRHPNSLEVGSLFIETLAASGYQEKALDVWDRLSLQYPGLLTDRQVLEEIAWGVLKKELRSTQYAIRLSSLIGSYLTRDVRTVPILLKMMADSNAIIRSVAVQMSSAYGDAPLKDEIERMTTQEKVWMVRMQAIQSAGALRIKTLVPKLKALIQSDKTMIEERHAAIEALICIFDSVEPQEIFLLASSNRAGLRHLACAIATHFKVEEAKPEMLRLLNDTHPDVRVAALNSIGLFYREKMSLPELREALKGRLEETDARVAITAAWAATLVDPAMGTPYFEKWLQDPISEHRRLAAAALSATGDRGVQIAERTLQTSEDPYVRANVALGLIGQRKSVKIACDSIYAFLNSEKRMWMWDNRPNPLFKILAPSQVRHVDQIPNYPEAMDQMTRLNLVSLLAIVEDPRAIDAIKQFLQVKKWNITGVAAATLLREGDETALEVVRTLLDDADAHVRLQACLVLAMYGKDGSVLKQLQDAYPEADFEMKLHILEALGSVSSPATFSFLIGVLRSPFPLLRIAAASALIQTVNK